MGIPAPAGLGDVDGSEAGEGEGGIKIMTAPAAMVAKPDESTPASVAQPDKLALCRARSVLVATENHGERRFLPDTATPEAVKVHVLE